MLQNIRPFPKANGDGVAKKLSKGRKEIKALFDTTEKQLLEEEQTLRKQNSNSAKRNKSRDEKEVDTKRKKKRGKEVIRIPIKTSYRENILESSDDETEDSLCPYCLESYTESSRVTWIQCNKCKKWAHEKCAHKLRFDFFYCLNCDSDDEN